MKMKIDHKFMANINVKKGGEIKTCIFLRLFVSRFLNIVMFSCLEN